MSSCIITQGIPGRCVMFIFFWLLVDDCIGKTNFCVNLFPSLISDVAQYLFSCFKCCHDPGKFLLEWLWWIRRWYRVFLIFLVISTVLVNCTSIISGYEISGVLQMLASHSLVSATQMCHLHLLAMTHPSLVWCEIWGSTLHITPWYEVKDESKSFNFYLEKDEFSSLYFCCQITSPEITRKLNYSPTFFAKWDTNTFCLEWLQNTLLKYCHSRWPHLMAKVFSIIL